MTTVCLAAAVGSAPPQFPKFSTHTPDFHLIVDAAIFYIPTGQIGKLSLRFYGFEPLDYH